MDKTQVSVIFVNYNTEKMTIEAVKSVFDKTENVIFEVFVVDNASSDNSVNGFKKAFGDKITVIESKENLGFGGGNNLGIKASKGKYVFLLNTDTLLINNAIKILFDFMEQNPQAGVCGGSLYGAEGKPVGSFRKRFLQENESVICKIFRALKMFISGNLSGHFNFGDKNIKVDVITGADMMIRREALIKSGLFDTDFFMYLEEDELTVRITKNGYFSYFVPAAKITHLVYGSFKGSELSGKRLAMYAYGEFLFFEKVYGKDAVKKYYKKSLLFIRIINVLTLGIIRKFCLQKEKTLNDAYLLWQAKRG